MKPNCFSPNILLGVTGGIAAYKAADLASKLTAEGAAVRVMMTENACKLIGPKTFEAITGQHVFTSMWTDPDEFKIGHVQMADWADAVVVAPATANMIGKVANGICDDLLSTTLCVFWDKPVLFAPAMNNRMWANPIVQRNINQLEQMKFAFVGPGTGRLACGVEAVGRMAEPSQIVDAIKSLLQQSK